MKFGQPLLEGVLVGRRQRFLADVRLADGSLVTAHCPNTGSMMGCAVAGSRVWLSDSGNAERKYRLTWELVEVDGVLIGINTARSNALVAEAVVSGAIARLAGYPGLRREVRFGAEGSRVDLLLEGEGGARCYVEVKNVTAAVADGAALFPDAVSERASKHLRELAAMVREGHRAVVCFCVQRGDVSEVRPADLIDPVYGVTLRQAMAQGVETLALEARVSISGIDLSREIPVVVPSLPLPL